MKLFNSIGHVFAWILHVALPKAATAATDVEQAAATPLAGFLAQLLGSKGAAAQKGIEAIAGDVLHAFGAAGEAIGAGGLNVQFDQATVEAIQTLYADVAGLFGKQPVTSSGTEAK